MLQDPGDPVVLEEFGLEYCLDGRDVAGLNDQAIALAMAQQPPQESRTRHDHVSVGEIVEEYTKTDGEEGKTTVERFSLVRFGSFTVA